MIQGRTVRLKAGRFFCGNDTDTEGRDLSGLDISFDVTRSVEFYDNCATIDIYNASPDTIGWLMGDGNSVILEAGSGDDVGKIFVGQIAMVKTERDGAGYRTTLTCVSARGAFYQLSRLHVAVAFEKGTSVRECLDTLCSYAGIALRAGFSDVLGEGIPWNFNESGSFRAVAKHFAEYVLSPYFRKKIYIDNNEMIVMDFANSVQLEETILDYSSGLLSATEKRDETLNRVNFGDDPEYYLLSEKEEQSAEEYHKESGTNAPKNSKVERIDRPREIEFRALLTPRIAPNVFCEVDSRTGGAYDSVLAVHGRFVVTRAEYSGSNFGGEFSVSCEACEVEQLKKDKGGAGA